MRASPINGFASIGGHGGPFTVTSQTLHAVQFGTFGVELETRQPGGVAQPFTPSGVLASGAMPPWNFTVSLNAAASNLVVSTYSSPLWITQPQRWRWRNCGFSPSRSSRLPPSPTVPVNQSVLQGQNVRLTVGAQGAEGGLTYHWRDNGTNLTDTRQRQLSGTTNVPP